MALGSHLSRSVIVGPKQDQWLNEYCPNPGSVLFVLGTTTILVNMKMLPCTGRHFPKVLLWSYHILATIFINTTSLLLVWLPLTKSINNMNGSIAQFLVALNPGLLTPVAELILSSPFYLSECIFAGTVYLGIILHSTGMADPFVDRIMLLLSGPQECGGGEPAPAETCAVPSTSSGHSRPKGPVCDPCKSKMP